MPSTILAHTEVAAQIDLLSAWIEAQMAYRGQPGYRTEGRLYLSDKIAVIVLTNADDGNPLMYVDKAYQWIAPAILKAVTPAPTATTPNPV